MKYDIQLLTTENSRLLQRVQPEVFDNPIDVDQLHAFLQDERHIMFIAVDGDTVIGMASAVEYFHPDKQPQLWINEVGVAPAYRNQGVGRALVQALLQAADDRNCVFAWLGTDTDNHAAQACFGSVPDVEDAQPFLLYEWEFEQ